MQVRIQDAGQKHDTGYMIQDKNRIDLASCIMDRRFIKETL